MTWEMVFYLILSGFNKRTDGITASHASSKTGKTGKTD
ncbi:hypothetical protein MC7420_5540 [Coleofasciculus chthonoplastes PCC 7420]|uniref:Uncharacterized protein n=1 Tax=Coleofasciculus chthonoplastes PCC 7420 TaxID=118168 RepID=B4VQ86_9CYAN|nr:hypothetical protein MC7420_5540 [Coleofasciculus chthonoplastes PCC 7420]